jgi:formate dehydrogenase subunit delta
MNTENLVKMANDIGNFFNAEPDREAAVHSVADHLKKFWDPRMRRAILSHYREGGVGMSEVVRAAVELLDEETASLKGAGDG